MDYEGQKLCENLFYYIILIFGGIGWVYGYIHQDFVYVFYAWSVGVVISVVVSGTTSSSQMDAFYILSLINYFHFLISVFFIRLN